MHTLSKDDFKGKHRFLYIGCKVFVFVVIINGQLKAAEKYSFPNGIGKGQMELWSPIKKILIKNVNHVINPRNVCQKVNKNGWG